MFVLKCESCGFEQVVKKRIDKDVYEKLTNNKGLYCDRNACDGKNSKVPNGYVRVYGIFGGWTVVLEATLDDYRAIKRARELRDSVNFRVIKK